MPYWGLALAIGPNYNDTAVDENRAQATYDAVRKAVARAPKASAREQDYIARAGEALSVAGSEVGLEAASISTTATPCVRWSTKYPDDLDAATLFAESLMMLRPWQLWTLDGEPAPGTPELVAVLESVLKRDPDHPGANHFYIHAVEASPQPRARHPERDAVDDVGAGSRPSRAHAGPHLSADRRLRAGRRRRT